MRTLGKSFVVVTSIIVLFCSVILFANAVEINQNNVPIKTNTDIQINGNITDIKSNTTVGGGSVGVNTFGKFNVANREVVNLHLIGSQTKLINLIYDSSPSQINGIVNSYMNGKIGGNVLFANPNGFVIGADGVFNVGSLTLVTPTQQSMNSFINDIGSETPSFNETQLNKLISFSFNGDNYLVCGDTVNPIKLEKSLIEISGKINSANGIDIISGGNVEIKEGAQLNANLNFNYNEDGTLAGFSKKIGVTPNLTSSSKTFAMNDGNGIIIVSSNDGEKSDYLSAFVNLKGSVDANGSNIIVKSEASKTNISANITVDGSINVNEIYLGSDGSISSTSAEIVANILEVLANNEISLVNKGNLTISSITSKSSSVSLKSLEGSINVTDFNSKTDANINAFGDVILGKTTIGNNFNASAKNLTFNGVTSVTGETSLKATEKLTFVPSDVTFNNNLTITKGTGIVEVNHLTVNGDAIINSNGKTTIQTATVQGDLTTDTNELDVVNKLTVKGTSNLTTAGALTLETSEFAGVTINSGSAEITSLKSTGEANLTTTGALTLETGEFAKVTMTSNNGSVGVSNLTSSNNVVINSNNGNTTLETVKVDGTFDVVTKNLEITTGMDVGGKVTITSTGNVVVTPDATLSDLEIISAKDVTFGKLKVSNVASITNDGKLTLGTGEFAKVTMTSNNGSVGVSNLTSSNNVVINSNNGNTTLETVKVDGTFDVVTKDLKITTGMNVAGKVTITSTGNVVVTPDATFSDLEISANKLTYKNLTVNGTANITVTNDFTAKDVTINNLNNLSANNITIDNLNVTENASIVAKGLFKTETATVSGNLTKLETNNAEIGSLTVTKDANIKATGKITADTIDVSGNLTKLETKNADIKNLTVDKDATIVSNGDVILGKTTIENDFNASAKNLTFNDVTSVTGETSLKATNKLTFVPSDVTFNNNLTITKGTGIVEVNHLTVTGDADINSNGKTTIKTATVQGDLTTDTNELEVVNKLTVTNGDTYLGSKTLITLNDAELDNLKMNAHDATIDNMVVHDYVDINANGDVSIKTANVEGIFTSKTANLEITDKLTADKDVNMTASNSIKIKDADIEKDLNTSAKTITIDEMNLKGKFNSEVDTLSVNTSNDLNIATIFGNSKAYTNKMYINSDKAILNALDNSKDINIYAKNIKMISNTNTATEDKPLNLRLVKNNNITLLSNGDIEIFTTGAVGNYRKIVTDYLDIKTDSYGVNVYSAIVNIYGDIRTANKHIIIDNTTWAPNLYVTLQLRSIISPHFLFVNRSPFIRTQSLNALRHGMNIYVNKTKDATSMNSWLVSSAEAQLKTSNTAKKFFDKTDSKLNVWSTLDSYISNNFSDEGSNMVIKTIKGEIMTPDNMDEFVNSNHNDIARPKRRLFRRNKTAETIQVSYLK